MAVILVAASGAASASAGARPIPVTIQFQAFSPDVLDALPGDTVTWNNTSDRTHTVTAFDGKFDSGYLGSGRRFSELFTATGAYTYHCLIHPGMVGEIDVRAVTLGPLPTAAVAPKTTIQFDGRTADPTIPVQIQSNAGDGFQTVATVTPAADGSWQTHLAATKTARYRAVSGTGVSETRRLIVIARAVHVRVTRRGIAVHAVPAAPDGRIALEFRLRDRFGWWIVARKRLDYLSNATFRVSRRSRVLARVILLGADHWTALATSSVLRIGRR